MVLDKCGSRTSTFDFQAMASVLCFGVFICGRDEWDDEILKRSEELGSSLVCNEILQCFTHMLLLFVVSIVRVFGGIDNAASWRDMQVRSEFRNESRYCTLTSLTSSARLRGTSVSPFVCPLVAGIFVVVSLYEVRFQSKKLQ